MNTRLIVIIVAVIAVLGAGGAFAYSLLNKKASPAPTTTPTTTTTATTQSTTTQSTTSSSTTATGTSILTADPAAATAASKQRFTAAQDKIKQWTLWKPNAVFSGLFMTFDATLQMDSANEVYVFDSPDDTNDHYTVSVAQATGNALRAIIPIADFEGTLLPIDQTFWQSNYVDAVQIAQANGGKAFAATNQITSVDVKLERSAPKNFLDWVVIYHTKDATVSLTVKLDAKDKSIIKE